MTCSISAVAVCCSKVSRVSVMRRAFSIAITACAAKFCKSAISFSENGRTPWRWALMKPCRLASLRSATKSVVRRSVSSRRRAWPRSPAPSFRAAADRRGRRGFRRPPASACRRWGGRGSAPRPRTLPDSQALPRHGNARRHTPRRSGLGPAEPVRFVEDHLEHRRDVARRAVDGVEHLGQRRFPGQRPVALGRPLVQFPLRFVPLSSALGALASKIGDDLLRIG